MTNDIGSNVLAVSVYYCILFYSNFIDIFPTLGVVTCAPPGGAGDDNFLEERVKYIFS